MINKLKNIRTELWNLFIIESVLYFLLKDSIGSALTLVFMILTIFYHFGVFNMFSLIVQEHRRSAFKDALSITRFFILLTFIDPNKIQTILQIDTMTCLIGFFFGLFFVFSYSINEKEKPYIQMLNPEISPTEYKKYKLGNKERLLKEFTNIYNNLMIIISQKNQILLPKLASEVLEQKLKNELKYNKQSIDSKYLNDITNLRITNIKEEESTLIITVDAIETVYTELNNDYKAGMVVPETKKEAVTIKFKKSNSDNVVTEWIIEDIKTK